MTNIQSQHSSTADQPVADMYAAKRGGMYELRQVRYRKQLSAGNEHPHDVCAIASSASELHRRCLPHWPDADFSQIAAEVKVS